MGGLEGARYCVPNMHQGRVSLMRSKESNRQATAREAMLGWIRAFGEAAGLENPVGC